MFEIHDLEGLMVMTGLHAARNAASTPSSRIGSISSLKPSGINRVEVLAFGRTGASPTLRHFSRSSETLPMESWHGY